LNPYLEKTLHKKKKGGEMAQGVGLEVKPSTKNQTNPGAGVIAVILAIFEARSGA
jgi:hypothetical protein